MRKKSSSRIILIISCALIVLVLGAIAMDRGLKLRVSGKEPITPYERTQVDELLIKGCLFDLGIAREEVRIGENSAMVETRAEFTEIEIVEAFSRLGAQAKVTMRGVRRIELLFDERPWEIIFQKPPEKLARIAIIVDDLGLDLNIAKQLSAIDADLTFSILPRQPHTKRIARYLHAQKKEILLHLPMEGNGKDPGVGAIMAGMSRTEMEAILESNFKEIPHAVGVNNHMGSVITADEVLMGIIYQDLGKRGLFFIDSLTTNRSICSELASQLRLPFNARDVFLDNEQDPAYIRAQLKKLVSIARHYRSAIGICHPYPATIEVLAEELPRLKKEGVSIERVSTFVKR